jgi:CheY-like chemotaxis protein
MDVGMPIMGGVEACQRIRKMEQTGEIIKHVPIIAVTGSARPEQIDHLVQEGFDAVLTKPFQVPRLLKLIKELMEKQYVE